MINTRAAGDSRFARTGKDGAIYNADGVLLATVDSFTANVTYNNAAYSVLGNAQELETANTFKVECIDSLSGFEENIEEVAKN